MKATLRLTKRAEAHLRDAEDWYESRRAGLGDAFLEDVEAELEEIQRWPTAYPRIRGEIRSARLLRFPYKIGFLATAESIEVLVVHHERRDPLVWNDGESP